MPRNRGEQVKVFVPITSNNYKYGFKTNKIKFNAIGAELGQKSVVGETGVFYGCNKPKPGVARKTDATGSRSGFYAPKKAKALKDAGWDLSSTGSLPSIRTSGLSVTVAVDTPWGYHYAWNITAAEFDVFAPVGVFKPTDADKLIFGSYPKPPRASIKQGGGRTSSFIPPIQASIDAARAAGFSVTSPDNDWGLSTTTP